MLDPGVHTATGCLERGRGCSLLASQPLGAGPSTHHSAANCHGTGDCSGSRGWMRSLDRSRGVPKVLLLLLTDPLVHH